MLIISPQDQGSAGKFRHLTLVTRSAKATVALTKGEFVVTSIVAWDEAGGKV
jgi:Dipeptidyl peptidase IV (DPP IV) N-terminal region